MAAYDDMEGERVDVGGVSTDNHPPLIEEETFLVAQQVLAEHGQGAWPRGGAQCRAPAAERPPLVCPA
jgi:hypothetical protein